MSGSDQSSVRAPASEICAAEVLAEAKVLVVDDHESNVALLELLLRGAGITAVYGVTDAREVVPRCLELRPDLVLLDLHMPHMDGCEVLTALHAARPHQSYPTASSSPAGRSATGW
jgi:putative two-component system response regulator